MRDALFLAIFAGGALWSLRQPWIGIMLWTVISLMNPHQAFGYSSSNWPLASYVAIGTLVGLLLTHDRENPIKGAGPWLLVALMIWSTFGLLFAFHLEPSIPLWERSMKIWLMVLVSIALITSYLKLQIFIGVTVFSVAFYGIKGGIFTLMTGGNYRVWGPGGFIGGNNEIALSLLMVMPLLRYIQQQVSIKWIKLSLTACLILCAATVLGTYSRGAFVGIAAVALYFWWKSDSKLSFAILILCAAALLLPLMPDRWWDRMATIKTYEADASALGRINAWWNNWNVACDRLFGGSFMIYKPDVFARYAPIPEDIHAAHSIYFQILGEQGFVGLALFLGIGVATWRSASELIQLGRDAPGLRWARDLGLMIHVSMIGYAVPGAFLSLAYYDLPYTIMAIAALAIRIAKQEFYKQTHETVSQNLRTTAASKSSFKNQVV